MLRMRRLELARLWLWGSFALAGPLQAQTNAPPDERSCSVDTRIEARLEDEHKRLDGTVTQVWRNATRDRVSELRFHLYLNAFSNNRSTHLSESGGRLRDFEEQGGWGWQRVTSVQADGRDLMPSFRYVQPDGGSPDDRTVFAVDLPRPVGPGESVSVVVTWESQLPRVRRRTGFKDDFLLVAQWFPKLGVYEGGRGWNCHEFHASTEFYGNYGTYDVTLDLPAKYEGKVFGSGKLVPPPERRGERVFTRFVAPSAADQARLDATGKHPLVHDFTWTADPRFKVKVGTFHFDTWAARFQDEVAFAQRALGADKRLELRDVAVTVLIHPERERQWERHFEATCTALFFYGLWFGEYPYEHVTVVDPAWGARGAGGMEYPTLFTAGTQLFTTEDMHTPESVVVHECGHQFWFGLVGNNEFEAAWMDEGFNSFTDSEAMVRRFGLRQRTTSYSSLPFHGTAPAPAPAGGLLAELFSARKIPLGWFEIEPLRSSGFIDFWRDQPHLAFVEEQEDPRWADRRGYLADPDRDPVDTPGWLYADSTSYRTNSYPRTAVILRSLPAAIGEGGYEKFLRGMRHYSELWRYRHPYPDDFFAAFNEGAGVDMGWYFQDLFRTSGTVDWEVSVDQQRAPKPRGFFQADPSAPFVDSRQPTEPSNGQPDDQLGKEDSSSDGEHDESGWKSRILVARHGELRLPLTIRWTFEDGTSETRLWTRDEQAQKRWLRIEALHPKKLKSVVLDPERGYQLDTDMSNNAWYDETEDVAPWRWAERAFTRYAHWLHWQAGLGG
jgi:peptidase M1-like protein